MITIVAHRGAPRYARENTIESFVTAVGLGADMVELDIRKCKDGSLVIFHDPWLVRSTHGSPLAEMTLPEINERAAKRGFSVPTMEEAFKTLSGKTQLDIELKEPGCEGAAIACARKYFDDAQFVLTSFNPRIIGAIKAIDKRLQTGFILADAAGLALAETTPAEVIAPDKRLFSVNRAVFAKLNKLGKKIAVWTVDSTELLSRMLVDPLVDAIITNNPDKALALRKKLTGRQDDLGA